MLQFTSCKLGTKLHLLYLSDHRVLSSNGKVNTDCARSCYFMRSEVLTVLSTEIVVFSDVTPYNMVDKYRRLGGTCLLQYLT
jgi:hypothetical protein